MGELAYLQALADILKEPQHPNRTSQLTRSKVAVQLRFNLTENDQAIMPILTTKKMARNAILHELLWFVRGQTDNKLLQEKNVKIWDANGSRDFLDKRGLKNREIGDLGPIYGFQWRHWNAPYVDSKYNYDGLGIDQLSRAINTIKNDPYSRRIIVNSWNVSQLDEMALPPCHILYQFIVTPGDKKYLSCVMTQRSADMPLGVPFNIASYAYLTHMVAKLTNTVPKELIITFNDAHIYANQEPFVPIQLERKPYPFPKFRFAEKEYKKLEDFNFEDFIISDYVSHPEIPYPFTV
jgi:thymidylate synthase